MTFSVELKVSAVKYYYKHKNTSTNIEEDIKEIFDICKSTLYNWISSIKINKEPIIYIPKRTYVGKITPEITDYIIKVMTTKEYVSMKNLRRSITRLFNVLIKKSSIYHILNKNKITYKGSTINRYPFSDERLKLEKANLRNQLEGVDLDNIISFDECYMSPENLEKTRGWAKKGQRREKNVNGQKYKEGRSLLLAISNNKIVGRKIVKGSVNGEIVLQFIKKILKYTRNKVIILDNARTHHYHKLKAYINKTNRKLVYNIPYHPQTNPIEFINNVIKNDLKKKNISDITKLDKFLENAEKKVTSTILKNCFDKAFKNMNS